MRPGRLVIEGGEEEAEVIIYEVKESDTESCSGNQHLSNIKLGAIITVQSGREEGSLFLSNMVFISCIHQLENVI